MKVVVLGGGTVGIQIVKDLLQEHHDVVLIEKSTETAHLLSSGLDCLVVNEDGSDADALRQALARDTDFFIAVTGSDEVNIIACGVVAQRYSQATRIARVRNPSYASLLAAGALLFVTLRIISGPSGPTALSVRGSYLFVVLGWLLSTAAGTAPMILSGAIPRIPDAFFEVMSGFSTTGASVLIDIEVLPQSILLWRSLTHWLGGMGIVVLTVALFPLLGIGGTRLVGAEAPERWPLQLRVCGRGDHLDGDRDPRSCAARIVAGRAVLSHVRGRMRRLHRRRHEGRPTYNALPPSPGGDAVPGVAPGRVHRTAEHPRRAQEHSLRGLRVRVPLPRHDVCRHPCCGERGLRYRDLAHHVARHAWEHWTRLRLGGTCHQLRTFPRLREDRTLVPHDDREALLLLTPTFWRR